MTTSKFDYHAEIAKAMREIVAKHPRMAEPCFAGALANSAINKVAPKLRAYKREVMGRA